MSALYGYLTNERGGQSTRAAHRFITADVQTTDRRVTVTMRKDGRYTVSVRRGSPGAGWWDALTVYDGDAYADLPDTDAEEA